MAQLTAIFTVLLEGDPPPEFNLPPLTGCQASADLVGRSFAPFASTQVLYRCLRSDPDFDGLEPQSGTILVYLVGHGWIDSADRWTASLKAPQGTVVVSGAELVDRLHRCVSPHSSVILLLDTCNAAGWRPDLQGLKCANFAAVFASDKGENAWNLVRDGTTRFAFEVHDALASLARSSSDFDAVQLAGRVKQAIDKDSMGFHQSVAYTVQGNEIRVSPLTSGELSRRRLTTFRRLRTRLLVAGGLVVAAAFLGGMYWRNHVLVTVDLGEVSRLVNSASIEVYELHPDRNSMDRIRTLPINDEISVWSVLPATDLLITFNAIYKDTHNRVISFHRVFHPTLTVAKAITFSLPSPDEIKQRPGMAYVSADAWLRGNPQAPTPPPAPYWIDIAPPTISEYFPFVYQQFRDGEIEAHESMLIWNLIEKGGISSEDISRSRSAEGLLTRSEVRASLLGEPGNPAPMTEKEARMYVRAQGKQLPSRSQWELAVRGVDGRTYPWGNRKDDSRINAGLPRLVGWEGRQKLRSVNEHTDAVSPFGLIDTVGNAGDWVEDDGFVTSDDEPHGIGFMGGVYQLNVEDCTSHSFTRLPINVVDLLPASGFWMITCRGVGTAQ